MRRWPWLLIGVPALALEVYAIRTRKVAPLTHLVGEVRGTWPGRLVVAAVFGPGVLQQHFDEAH